MEKQNGGVPGIGRRKRTDRPCGESHRTYQEDYITRRLSARMWWYRAIRECIRHSEINWPPYWTSLAIEADAGVDDELLDTINLIASIMDGMKEEDVYGN